MWALNSRLSQINSGVLLFLPVIATPLIAGSFHGQNRLLILLFNLSLALHLLACQRQSRRWVRRQQSSPWTKRTLPNLFRGAGAFLAGQCSLWQDLFSCSLQDTLKRVPDQRPQRSQSSKTSHQK